MPPHISVLLPECMQALIHDRVIPLARIIDGTLGAGGHTEAFLQHGIPHVLAFDLDTQAIAIAQSRLTTYLDTGRLHIVHDSYLTMGEYAFRLGWHDGVDAILLDLGVSSMQFDTPERGFAFMHDAPLDMRFDTSGSQPTAADIVNTWASDALADILWHYGEERHHQRIARAIVAARPLNTTQQLANVVQAAVPPPNRKQRQKASIHPATRTFQALRIAVNEELTTVEKMLPLAIKLLRPGGRLAVISFHSLEDRLVKRAFKDASTHIEAPPGMASIETKTAQVRLITRKPIIATDAEIADNPRSRSAKLRVVEKLPTA